MITDSPLREWWWRGIRSGIVPHVHVLSSTHLADKFTRLEKCKHSFFFLVELLGQFLSLVKVKYSLRGPAAFFFLIKQCNLLSHTSKTSTLLIEAVWCIQFYLIFKRSNLHWACLAFLYYIIINHSVSPAFILYNGLVNLFLFSFYLCTNC